MRAVRLHVVFVQGAMIVKLKVYWSPWKISTPGSSWICCGMIVKPQLDCGIKYHPFFTGPGHSSVVLERYGYISGLTWVHLAGYRVTDVFTIPGLVIREWGEGII